MAFPVVTTVSTGNSGGNVTSQVIFANQSVNPLETYILAVCNDGDAVINISAEGPALSWVTGQLLGTAVGTAARLTVYKAYSGANSSSGTEDLTIGISASEAVSWVLFKVTENYSTISCSTAATGTTQPNSPNYDPSWAALDTTYFSIYGWDGNRSHTTYPANYTSNQQTDRYAASTGCGIASSSRDVSTTSEDPGAAVISADDDWVACTLAIKGAGKLLHGSSASSMSGTATGGVVHGISSGRQYWPQIIKTKSDETSLATTYTIPISGHAAGDRIYVVANSSRNSIEHTVDSSTGTWTNLLSVDNGATDVWHSVWYRDVAGSGETLVLRVANSNTDASYAFVIIASGTFDSGTAPELGYLEQLNDGTPPCPSKSLSWASDRRILSIIAFGGGWDGVRLNPPSAYNNSLFAEPALVGNSPIGLGVLQTTGNSLSPGDWSGGGSTLDTITTTTGVLGKNDTVQHASSVSGTATGEVVTGTGTNHPIASTGGVAQLDGTSTGLRVAGLGATAESSLSGTSTGVILHGLASTSASSASGTGVGTRRAPLESTPSGQVDTTSTGVLVHGLGSTTSVAQVDTTATGGALLPLGSSSSASLSGTSTGVILLGLTSSSGAQLDGTATGGAYLPLSSTSAAQLDGTATGSALTLHTLAATSASTIDGTSTGIVTIGLVSTADASLSGTATATAILSMSSSHANQVDATSSGTALRPLAATSSGQLDGTATGQVLVIHTLSSTLASSIDSTSTGLAIHALGGSASQRIDTTATGWTLFGLIGSAQASLSGTATGGALLPLNGTHQSQVDTTSTGLVLGGSVSLEGLWPESITATASGNFMFAIDASLAAQLDSVSNGTRVQYLSNYIEP